jgi:hypothetical protein
VSEVAAEGGGGGGLDDAEVEARELVLLQLQHYARTAVDDVDMNTQVHPVTDITVDYFYRHAHTCPAVCVLRRCVLPLTLILTYTPPRCLQEMELLNHRMVAEAAAEEDGSLSDARMRQLALGEARDGGGSIYREGERNEGPGLTVTRLNKVGDEIVMKYDSDCRVCVCVCAFSNHSIIVHVFHP